jgi:hypothetical protein
MYIVKKQIASLAHGREFQPGVSLYGNEFPSYTFAHLLADGIIEVYSPDERNEIEDDKAVEEVLAQVEAEAEIEEEVKSRPRKRRNG